MSVTHFSTTVACANILVQAQNVLTTTTETNIKTTILVVLANFLFVKIAHVLIVVKIVRLT